MIILCILYRPIGGIRGFTRETVIAVSNIEGREFHHRKIAEIRGVARIYRKGGLRVVKECAQSARKIFRLTTPTNYVT